MDTNFPTTARARAARRNKIRADQRDIADRNARKLARSIKCGEYGWHADREGGCANDGTGCLCECHDPQ